MFIISCEFHKDFLLFLLHLYNLLNLLFLLLLFSSSKFDFDRALEYDGELIFIPKPIQKESYIPSLFLINEVKKMPKYKILNSLRNNNNLNIYMKNREEIYKDLYKNVGIKSELIDLLHKNKSIMDKTEGNTGNFSQIKIPNEPNLYKARNRLSPISIGKKDDYFL